MTRSKNTIEESKIGQDLLNHLKIKDPDSKLIERELADKPDLLFQFKSDTIGCECTQIPPGRIYKYVHTRFKELSKSKEAIAIRVVWPLEPHEWVKEAILKKVFKIESYKKNSNSNKIWLLIHTPLSEQDNSVRYKNPSIMELIYLAANNTKHKFDRIYFWNPIDGIKLIYPSNHHMKDCKIDLKNGYPTDNFLIGTAPFTTTKEGEEPKTYDYGVVKPKVIIIPPKDKNFKKSRPNYRNRFVKMKIVASSNSAQMFFENVEAP